MGIEVKVGKRRVLAACQASKTVTRKDVKMAARNTECSPRDTGQPTVKRPQQRGFKFLTNSWNKKQVN
jgi:hypothetical protein